MMCRPCGKTTL